MSEDDQTAEYVADLLLMREYYMSLVGAQQANTGHAEGVMTYLLPRGPSQSIDQQFTVRCPKCSTVYVSQSVTFLGIATRKTYMLFVVLLAGRSDRIAGVG